MARITFEVTCTPDNAGKVLGLIARLGSKYGGPVATAVAGGVNLVAISATFVGHQEDLLDLNSEWVQATRVVEG